PAVVSTAVATVPAGRGGLASGLTNTARQVGGTLGVAVLGGVVAGTGSTVELGDVRVGLVVVALAYLGAAVTAARLLPGTRPSEGGRQAPC
nr:hypothetical protein [Micromonospora sp. DSM 115978]